jgi:hypothetical protein
MFPFRVFNQPILYQGNPTWTDDNGIANYRTFSVWTGNAIGYVPLGGSYAAGWILSPETVQVARTAGYNFKIPTANESYNEAYSQQSVGLYGGPYTPTSTEIMFTAPPNSFAAFWITWDANVTVNGIVMPVWPVLHFGGIAFGGTYFGDANAVNFINDGPSVDGGLTFSPDLIALAQTSPFPTSFPAILVALIQVGISGADDNATGNDGTAWIIQCLHDHVQKGLTPSYRGDYAATSIYFPGDSVHFIDGGGNDLVCQNSSQYAISLVSANDFPQPFFGDNNDPNGGLGFTFSPWSALGTPYYQELPENLGVTITDEPSSQDAFPGSSVQFQVTLEISGPSAGNGVTVQWYIKPPGVESSWIVPTTTNPVFEAQQIVDSIVYAGSGNCSPNYVEITNSGTQTAYLNISNATGMGGFTFYAQIMELGRDDVSMSATATVTLNTDPMCTIAPKATSVVTGDPAIFWCAGTGTDALTYQWQISTDGGMTWTNTTDGAVYSGSTTAQLYIISTATLANLDQFRCQLTSFMATVPTPGGILGLV